MREIFAGTVLMLFGGCAGIAAVTPAVTPYTTQETEIERAKCLDQGHTWVETQHRYGCIAPGLGVEGPAFRDAD